jgi:hypothetical protein
MTPTLKVFMQGLIDYAGLFPPARLDMPDAAATFARHLGGEYAWMLGCFICPVVRLDELAEQRPTLEKYSPIRVSVLGTAPTNEDDHLDLAVLDAERVARFETYGWAQCTQLEVKWPHSLISARPLRRYASRLSQAGCTYRHLFFEIDRRDSWDGDVVRMAAALAEAAAVAEAGGTFGFKIRTGGLTADLYPSPDQIAVAVEACRDAGVPLKATAGLHHPIRHDRSTEGVTQHGFFNVFGAAALAYGAGLDRGDLVAIIEDRRLSEFTFDSTEFGWGRHAVGIEALGEARARLAFSYGSCNFDEPLEDLAAAAVL